MNRSPDSLIPSAGGQPPAGKRDDKASSCRQGGEANPRAARNMNAASASSTPPAIRPTQLELFPGRACLPKAKPAMDRVGAMRPPVRRDGVQGGGTRRKRTRATGETLHGPSEEQLELFAGGRDAHKGVPRTRRPDAVQGVGGGRSTDEPRDNRGEGRAAASAARSKQGKAAGLPPRGKARSRSKPPRRLDNARKLQRTLYRSAKLDPGRRFTRLYDKVCRPDILAEAWGRVRRNGGSAGVDRMSIASVQDYGEERFLQEVRQALLDESYRVAPVRRVHIPKPGKPGKTRPLGIPTVKDRVVQMAVKMVLEPLFEPDFRPCSFGFRPKRSTRMALGAVVAGINAGLAHVVDVDLASYYDSIDQALLVRLVERRVGDVRVLRLIRAWLRAGIMEEGTVTHPVRGTPQGGVISPLLANVVLHEVDRCWCRTDGTWTGPVRLIRYADDMVLLARTASEAEAAWRRLQGELAALRLVVNQEKSRLATVQDGFSFLGFDFAKPRARPLYLWPCARAQRHIRQRTREVARSFRSTERLDTVIQKLNPVLVGWCTYFRVGNSNRAFHSADWAARSELQLWLRRKHRCTWRHAAAHWNYRYLHERCRLYRMVGKVSHLEGLRRTPPAKGSRRAGCGKTARPVR
jgi:RNA-directed DNA polymerase